MKKTITLLLLGVLCSIGNVWGDVTYHTITPNIDNTSYETFYLFKNSSDDSNVIGKAFSSSTLSFSSSVTGSWVEGNCTGKDNSGDPGDFSAQGFYKTAAGDLKFNGTTSVLTFHVTGCVGVALLGKGNSSTKPLQLSVKEKGKSSEVGSIAQNASNSVAVISYGTTLDDSKEYDITISSVSGGNSYAYQIRFEAPSETYTVTINPNGGSYASTPTGWTLTDGKYTKSGLSGSFNVPDGLAKENKDLNGWKDRFDNTISLPITLSKDTILYAQWVDHAQSSDATLSALSVADCTLNETFAPATTAYTVNLPFYASMPVVGDVTATKNDSYAKTPAVSISDNVITVACEAEDGTKKTYTITVTIADVPTASSSINIEQLILDYGTSYNIGTALTAAHIAYVDKDVLDSLLMGTESKAKTDCNEAYLGLKFKKSTSKVTIIVPSGQSLNVKFGATNNLTVSVNGSTAAAPSLTNNVYSLAASDGAKEVIFALTGTQTVVFKQIMINEAIATVRPFKIESITATNGTATTDLAKYAKGETVTVNYTPSSGYRLSSISVSGYDNKGAETSVTVSNTNEFTMPGSPVNITATFIPSTVSASFSADWATFASIYPLDLNLTDGITGGLAYAAKEITTVGGHDQVVLTPCTGVVPANTGLMIKKVGSATSFTIATSTETPSAPESNLLEGAAEGASLGASDNAFILANTSGLGFYKVVSDITLAAGKAYLVYDGDITPAPSGIRIVVEENTTTAVEAIEASEKAVKFFENGNLYIKRDGVVYDVTGRVIR